MTKRNEIVPMFKEGDKAFHKTREASCKVLKVNTYCMCCDRFLDEVQYAVLFNHGVVDHRVPESLLDFPKEVSV
jgi:hypothetical protein